MKFKPTRRTLDLLPQKLSISLLLGGCIGLTNLAMATTVTPLTQQKVSAGTPVTVLFLGDSDTAGCGTGNDDSGNSTFPAVFASLLASQMPSQIGVTRIDQSGTSDNTNLGGLCPAYAAKQTTVKTGVFGSHQIVRSGVGDNTAIDIANRLNTAFANFSTVDLVVVMVGINDSLMKFTTGSSNLPARPGYATSPSAFRTNLTNLVQSIKTKTSAEILLVSEFTNGGSQNGSIAGVGFEQRSYTFPADAGTCNSTLGASPPGTSYSSMACSLKLYNDIVMSVGTTSGSNVHALDLHQTLMTLTGVQNETPNPYASALINYWLSGDPYHPNDIGYRVIGEQIFYNTLNIAAASPPPAISNAGITRTLSPWAGWIYSSNITSSLRVNVDYISTDSSGSYIPWQAQAVPTISTDGTWLSYSLPSQLLPANCKLTPSCSVRVTLKDLVSGQISNQYPLQLTP